MPDTGAHDGPEDFMEAAERLFGSSTARRLTGAILSGPDAVDAGTCTVTFGQLISLWNAGVENGVEGMKARYGSAPK